jgi:PncC family amidohydrolase
MLVAEGAVSEAIVRAMAEGARRTLGTDVGLAISGVAGPTGGTTEKPVGLVHWAVSDESGTHAFQRVFRGDRAQVQRRAALSGLWSLRKLLVGKLAERT